ncbi:MAG: FKBP-type peptidyl-prolyl cis-trans isomerase [Tannerella sp.]|jgi:FKBP-type peptidyl-prolyl cis-trans isomerase FklB|nr:FKBP-type peptidyl-prolyl cis-trans isomerase [Tannerella sp.]
MKKLSILNLILIVVTVSLGSCSSFSSKTELKTEIDTASYYFGLSRAEGIMNYLSMQAGIDTAYMEDFYKGFREGSKNYGPKDAAYLEGMRIAHLINNQWIENVNRDIFMGDSGKSINRNAVLAGFYHGVKKSDEMQMMHAQTYSQSKMNEIKEQYKKEKYAESIRTNEKFLSDNKNKEGVETTESGLQYKIITEGRGDVPDEKSKVKVNYRGTLIDGTEFDSSYKNNAPATFRVNQVIKGWTEALKMMPTGSKWELYIPQDLAYGSIGQGANIPPYSTLIFEVELVEIEPEK